MTENGDEFQQVTQGAFGLAEQHMGQEAYQASVRHNDAMTEHVKATTEAMKQQHELNRLSMQAYSESLQNRQRVLATAVLALLLYSIPLYLILIVHLIKNVVLG